jgi:hypothetical protein
MRIGCILATSAIALAACGATSQRDEENYHRFEAARPSAFNEARIVDTWRGFTSWREDDTTQQCAVAIFDVSEEASEQFVEQLGDQTFEMGGDTWRIAGDTADPAESNQANPRSWEDPLVHIRTSHAFCDMPEARFEPFSAAVVSAWGRDGNPNLMRYDHYDGGVLGGPRKHLYFFGVLSREDRRLYIWFIVYPSSGG